MIEGSRDIVVAASDGLRLFARERGPRDDRALPVVCLPGLTRNSDDFSLLASALAHDPDRPRRTLALDYRGRGRSEWDRDWRRYDLRVELDDVLQVLTAAGIAEAVFVGTSRGGILTMALAASRPAAVRGAVLNDIGPVVEGTGLLRIRGYVGKLPRPRSYPEAIEILQRLSDAQFPAFTAEQWETMARTTWRDVEGDLVPAYDPTLMKTLEGIDVKSKIPPIWFLFEALKPVPVLAIRGENSDLLSPATFAAMQSAHPRLAAVTVPGQGHAPMLDGDLVERIRGFLKLVEDAPTLS